MKRWEALYGKLFYDGAWTETWPKEEAVRRSPYHADPYFVPPSAAGLPKLKPAQGTATGARGQRVASDWDRLDAGDDPTAPQPRDLTQ